MLFMDYETFSCTDLPKSNVYRYVEDPTFEALMCAWSVDGEPVKVAVGERRIAKIPGIFDPGVLKVAHNATFERVVTSTLAGMPVGTYFDPEGWIDPAVLAAEWGLPRSLKALAKAVGAPEKDEAGTRLINLFSKPNRRKRILANDKPEQWVEFINYCGQDVETLVAVYRRLASRGWPTEMERRLWVANERINDRGIAVDLDLARAAVAAGERLKVELMDEAKVLSGLENPNSTQQLHGWLEEMGNPLENLQAETVKTALEFDTLEPSVRRVLEIRQETALSALKKFDAAVRSTNSDGRLRGAHRFFGAHTGRFCLTGEHEVLTPDGWQRIDEWAGSEIACWSPDGSVNFAQATRADFPFAGGLVKYESSTVRQISTHEHRMPTFTSRGNFHVKTAAELIGVRHDVPVTGVWSNGAPQPNVLQTRALVMTQADGHFTKADGILKFGFKRDRKVQRCAKLLEALGIPFRHAVYDSGVTTISVARRHIPDWLAGAKQFGPDLWNHDADAFFAELRHWDGSRSGPNSFEYTTTNQVNADMVQAFAHLSGRTCRIRVRQTPDRTGWAPAYRLSIDETPGLQKRRQKSEHTKEILGAADRVYCAMTETGFFLVRREGSVWVTGNSGAGVQTQNLPRLSVENVEESIALVKGAA